MNNLTFEMPSRSSFASVLHGFGSMFRGLAWVLAALIVVAGIGLHILNRNRTVEIPKPGTGTIPPPIDWGLVDDDVREAIMQARTVATEHADQQLEPWINGLRHRVDTHFLDWYFGYWTQKALGFRAIRYWIQSTRPIVIVIGEQPEMIERITEDIQDEFAQRVLRPVIAQQEIERMTRSTLEVYVTELQKGIAPIPERYNIPRPRWERYLSDMALISASGRPDTVPITMKSLTASTVGVSTAGMIALYHALSERIAAVGAKFCAKSAGAGAGKAAAATAAKTGAATGAKAGSKMLGPIVLAVVVVWDAWDHQRSRGINEPLLRENLNDYLDLLHRVLLDDPEGGILTVVTEIEHNLHQSMQPGK